MTDLIMTDEEIRYHFNKLKAGRTYWDNKCKEIVEFQYMGRTGYAIVCEPGDSGGGMQSCWGTNPNNLEKIINK